MLFTDIENQKFKSFLIRFIPKMVPHVEFVDFDTENMGIYDGLSIKIKYHGNTNLDEGESFRIYYDIQKVISFYSSDIGSFTIKFQ